MSVLETLKSADGFQTRATGHCTQKQPTKIFPVYIIYLEQSKTVRVSISQFQFEMVALSRAPPPSALEHACTPGVVRRPVWARVAVLPTVVRALQWVGFGVTACRPWPNDLLVFDTTQCQGRFSCAHPCAHALLLCVSFTPVCAAFEKWRTRVSCHTTPP